ncbi:MAG: S9 family peptidase [Dysgonamonadaceae bacterium]|jgi:dipeptidyl aminopeptidase/acylaminoacyl peptidase|nr:S9 family peptidase [Dysgonamonadaceae bacterium]
MKTIYIIMLTASILTACNNNVSKSGTETITCKYQPKIEGGKLSAEVMHQLGQVSDPQVSPDGNTVLYGVTYTSIELNKRNRELFTVAIDGSNRRQITHSPNSESNAIWLDGGNKIAFLYDGQIWTMNPDGADRKQISKYQNGIEGFKFSPDDKKVMFVSRVKIKNTASEQYPDLDKTTGRIIDNLMYKHWDEWTTSVPHPFIACFNGKGITNIYDILEGEPYESPLNPFGGVEQLDWSPDSKTIAYTCRKKTGKAYTMSTNSDIFLYNLETKEVKNLTEDNGGYDTNPRFSPDGKYIAWLSMERDGYESDKNRLMISEIATGNVDYITEDLDCDVDNFCLAGNTGDILFTACVKGTTQIFLASGKAKGNTPKDRSIVQLTGGQHDYASVAFTDSCLIALRHSMSSPNEIFRLDPQCILEPVNISNENNDILSQITMGKVEEHLITTVDGKQMLTRVIYPPNFDPAKKYPALLFCQGGPQSAVSQFWSTRWNFQVMAAHDYIVVAPNRRGVPGFGTAWKEQISGDYGGLNMLDYLTAIDALAKEPYVDEARLGCTGPSYGGFSVYWLAGHHDRRFKAFWAHAGIFNTESQYLETEEMWFANWDLGGPFWDKSNKTAQKSFADSPHRFVDKWDTPIAISHGELDFRILASQGMMAFNAAQLRDIPSRMLIYPDENHWILKPQNAVLFQREFFRWFDKWLK